ncbi:MAG: hypothetical protein V4714_17170 [Bacteroidota bacterium]
MTNFIKTIAFTKTPLQGHFRFGDYFQVYPFISENGPNSKKAKHFPCIIELTFADSEIKKVEPFNLKNVDEMLSRVTVQNNKLIEITNLLSVISNYRFFTYRHLEGQWSIQTPDVVTEEMDNIRSTWTVNLFYYPQIAKEFSIKEFSQVDLPSIPFFDKELYYYYEPLESIEKIINFPTDINEVIEAYLKLSLKEKVVCDSAIHLFCNGLDIFDKMKSLSFLSIVSSIETLVNYEYLGEKIEYECNDCKTLKNSERNCQKCGRPIWGVSAKFREFLFKYVSDEKEAKKMYSKIYDIRSKIAHTDYLINGENYGNWDFSDKTEELYMRHIQAMQLGRRAISNWLRNKISNI